MDLFKSQRVFNKANELKITADEYEPKLKVRPKDKGFKIELQAMKALQTVRDQYACGFGI